MVSEWLQAVRLSARCASVAALKLSPTTEETLCSRWIFVWRNALKPRNYNSLCEFRSGRSTFEGFLARTSFPAASKPLVRKVYIRGVSGTKSPSFLFKLRVRKVYIRGVSGTIKQQVMVTCQVRKVYIRGGLQGADGRLENTCQRVTHVTRFPTYIKFQKKHYSVCQCTNIFAIQKTTFSVKVKKCEKTRHMRHGQLGTRRPVT